MDFGFYAPSISIGNRVWRDDDNDRVRDTGEPGIAGVRVELYADANADGLPDTPGAPLAFDTTDVSGYYLFAYTGDNDAPPVSGTTQNLFPGRYVVVIPGSNFNDGTTDGNPDNDPDPLFGFLSSTGVSGGQNQDNNDNGIDPGTTLAAHIADGVRSGTFAVFPFAEPTNDTDRDATTIGSDPPGTGAGNGRPGRQQPGNRGQQQRPDAGLWLLPTDEHRQPRLAGCL
ncbi:MAG: hypothetical protein HC915_14380 [Anaerolineae bacterium]|nr:hypothetical protein [Anaerolineae bacterium]